MIRRSPWLKHGFWNFLEFGLTRALDAGITILLIWVLDRESFARIAVAQAAAAPLLLFFISPSWALYRNFSEWKAQGVETLAHRLGALRRFGFCLAALSLALALVFAPLVPGEAIYREKASALLWALVVAIGAIFNGADREFLRLELRIRKLNAVTLLQKALLFGGTILSARLLPGRTDALAGVALLSMAVSGLWSTGEARAILRSQGWTGRPATPGARPQQPGTLATWIGIGRQFSLWNHVSGIVLNWVQTLDLFLLGVGVAHPSVAAYALAIKAANVSYAIPQAGNGIFLVWLGRRVSGADDGHARERRELKRLSLALLAIASLQALLIGVLADPLVEWLARGRWDAAERAEIVRWLRWMLAGAALVSGALLLNSWIALRGRMRSAFLRVYLPWIAVAGVIYGVAIHLQGPDGAAIANVPVALVYLGLVLPYVWNHVVQKTP